MKDHEFENLFNEEVNELVERFEKMHNGESNYFFEESSYEQIISYYEQVDNYPKALEVADTAIEQYPFSSGLLIRKAQLLFDLKRIDEALEVLEKAQILDPSDLEIFLLKADILLWSSQHAAAVRVIKKAIEIAEKEDLPDLYLELADIYEDDESYDKVLWCLEKTLDYDPENEEALSRIWFCVELTDNYKKSIRIHKRIIDRTPFNFLAWYNLAHAYKGMALYDKALEAFEYSIAINSAFENAYRDCAELLIELGRYADALDYLKEASELENPSPDIYLKIGVCYENLGKPASARKHYWKAVHANPNYGEAYFKIGENYSREHKWINAIDAYEKALKVENKNTRYLSALGMAHSGIGDYQKAAHYFQTAVELCPEETTYWIGLVQSLDASGETDNAIHILDNAIDRCGMEARFYFLQAALLYNLGKKKAALEKLNTGLILDFDEYMIMFQVAPEMKDDHQVNDLIESYLNY